MIAFSPAKFVGWISAAHPPCPFKKVDALRLSTLRKLSPFEIDCSAKRYSSVSISTLFGAPASRRVAQPRRGQSADSCLSAWPRSGSREFESAARRGEQRREVAQQGDRRTGVSFFLVLFSWTSKKKNCPAGAARPQNKSRTARLHQTKERYTSSRRVFKAALSPSSLPQAGERDVVSLREHLSL